MKLIHASLINNNLKLINNKTTFKRGEYKSQLDAIFTNKPQKVTERKQYENVANQLYKSNECTKCRRKIYENKKFQKHK